MGGKIWSKEEEDAFWRTIIPRSPKRLGADQLNDEESWDELAKVLTRIMGDDARRNYTALSLFEHWFQNVMKNRVSPNGREHVARYNRQMEAEGRTKSGPGFKPAGTVQAKTRRSRRKQKAEIRGQALKASEDRDIKNDDEASMTDAGSPAEAHGNNFSHVSAPGIDSNAAETLVSFRAHASDATYPGQAHPAHSNPGQPNQNIPVNTISRGTGHHGHQDNSTLDDTDSRAASDGRTQGTLTYGRRLRYRSQGGAESLYDSGYQAQNSAAPWSLRASNHTRQRHRPLPYSVSAGHGQQGDKEPFVRPASQLSPAYPTSQASNHDTGQNQHSAPPSTPPNQTFQQGHESPASVHHANFSSEHLQRSASVHNITSHSPGWANSRTAEWAHQTNGYHPNPYTYPYSSHYQGQYLGQQWNQYPNHSSPYPSHYQGYGSYPQPSGDAIGYQGHYNPIHSGPTGAQDRQFPLDGHPTGTEAHQHTAAGNATQANGLYHPVPSRPPRTEGLRGAALDSAAGNQDAQDPQDSPADLASATEDFSTGTKDAETSD